MRPKILVFIPMYNCEKQIKRVLGKFTPEIQEFFAEVLVVDNNSQDNGAEAAKVALQEMKHVKATLVQNKVNYSLGGSHKVAFNYAIEKNYDYCVVLHGDDQGDITDIVPVIKGGQFVEFDSLLGARFALGSKLAGYSKFRTFGNIVFNMIVSLLTKNKIYDMGSGLNLYKVDYLRDGFYLYFPNDLTFNVYMLLYGIWKKSSFKFFPLSWKEDDQISNAKIFKQAFKILTLLRDYLFSTSKVFSKTENSYSRITYGFNVITKNY